jgi:hypothetical protein
VPVPLQPMVTVMHDTRNREVVDPEFDGYPPAREPRKRGKARKGRKRTEKDQGSEEVVAAPLRREVCGICYTSFGSAEPRLGDVALKRDVHESCFRSKEARAGRTPKEEAARRTSPRPRVWGVIG